MTKRILISLAVLMAALTATAQSVIGNTGCGAATPILSCSFDANQINSIGEFAYATISADLSNNSDNVGRGIQFGNWQGPNGKYLGAATYQVDPAGNYRIYTSTSQVCSNGQCSNQVTVLSAYIEGEYVDGTSFRGLITLHFSYVTQYRYGTYQWNRSLAKAAGGVTIY